MLVWVRFVDVGTCFVVLGWFTLGYVWFFQVTLGGAAMDYFRVGLF
jgi:hypothetical protein